MFVSWFEFLFICLFICLFITIVSDDSGAATRSQSQSLEVLCGRRGSGDREHVGRPGAWARLEATLVWFVFLQRHRAREEEVWRTGMEYSIRVYSIGSGGT